MRFLNRAAVQFGALSVAIAVGTAACSASAVTPTDRETTPAVTPSQQGTARETTPAVTPSQQGTARETTPAVTPSQQGTAGSTRLELKEAYAFQLQADLDGACKWPVTTFTWPVRIQITSSSEDSRLGLVVFPPTPSSPSNTWSIEAGLTGTQLTPAKQSPGAAAAAYNVVVEGGRWQAGVPTRARDGRGEITSGTASGAQLRLVLPGSDRQWECRSDAKWSLLARYVDRD